MASKLKSLHLERANKARNTGKGLEKVGRHEVTTIYCTLQSCCGGSIGKARPE